jgi:hypothetical protein
MTLTHLLELIKLHHPHMTENEMRTYLNRAADDLCGKTELIKTQFSLITALGVDGETIANQRYYKLPEGLLEIQEVFLNGVRIPRTLTKPIIEDTTLEEDSM